jgi:hypothetical protein
MILRAGSNILWEWKGNSREMNKIWVHGLEAEGKSYVLKGIINWTVSGKGKMGVRPG